MSKPEGFTWRVVLRLDVQDPNELSGEIRFGEAVAQLPLRPDVDPTKVRSSGGGSFWHCSFQLPVEGFDYRILSGRSSSDGIDFDFAPNQIWEHWCATDKPVCPDDSGFCSQLPTCVCDAGECHADLRGRRRIQLSRTAETIEGHFGFGGGGSTPADIRLRRVR